MSIGLVDIAIQDWTERERRKEEEQRPRVELPLNSPEYLRYIEEQEQDEDDKEDSGRGVTIFQM